VFSDDRVSPRIRGRCGARPPREVDLSPWSIAFSSQAAVIKVKVRDGALHAAFVLARI